MNEIYIEVSGGLITTVYTNMDKTVLKVLDWDNYKAEDELGRLAMEEIDAEIKQKVENKLIKQIY